MAKLMKLSGLFDPVSDILPAVLWDGYKLKPEAKSLILGRLREVVPQDTKIFSSIMLIGSMLGYKYNRTSDIDVSLSLKPEYDYLYDHIKERCKNTNGWDMTGTMHPINFFPSPSGRLFRKEGLTAGYEILEDRWIKLAPKPSSKDQRRFHMDMPYLKLRQNELKRQLAQLVSNPNKEQEAVEVAKEFRRLDRDRKQSFSYPGLEGGNKSIHNAAYKYSLGGHNDHVIDALYHALNKSKGLTFYE